MEGNQACLRAVLGPSNFLENEALRDLSSTEARF